MKLFKIALSNIKKRKSSAITFFAIVVMSALMLSISLSLLMNIGSFYDKKRQALNTADFTIAVYGTAWKNEMRDYSENYEGVTKAEYTDCYMADIKYTLKNNTAKQQLIVYDDTISNNTMNTFNVIDKLSVKPSDSIILTLSFKYNGFKAGDKFSFKSVNKTYDFTIYGFFEDAQIGASTTGIKSAYVNEDAYSIISEDSNFSFTRNISLKFDRMEVSYNFQSDFLNKFNLSPTDTFSATYEMTKMAATMFAMIMSFVLILIAAIILSIALIIVNFSIKNNLDEDIKTYGALKSIGFTSKQLMATVIFQFLLIALAGSIVGVLTGALTAGYVGNVVSATSGLLWSNASFFVPALISAFIISAITALVTFFAARKTKTVTPINALRAGLSNHTFKKNYAPLDKNRMPLNSAIAVKSFFGNIKNNITAFLVLFMFAFSTVLGFSLYHNFVVDTTAFKQMIGLEPAQVLIDAKGEQLPQNIVKDIEAKEGVVKTLEFEVVSTVSDNMLLRIYVWKNIERKEADGLVTGRYPKNENEITLVSSMQKTLNKNIGDIVNIEYEGVSQSYLVTGITQGIGDVYSDMTTEGFLRLKAEIVHKSMYIYLNNDETEYIDSFVNELYETYGNELFAINFKEAINNTLVALESPIAIATYLITAIIIFTVCFVFFLLINTIIRRRKKDFGVMKALGFTSGQLITQMLLMFLPIIIFSVALGTVAGVFLTNPILGLMFSGIGVAKPLFTISAALTLITEISLAGVAVLTVYLVSLKMKNISPQKLIVEN